MSVVSPIFEGLRVVELASVLAGPAVGMFFAELGAEVIKIENRQTGGDVTRSWRLPCEDATAPESAYFCCVNWGKQTFMLNLEEAADKQKVYNWVREADIVISNFRPTAASRLGMSFEQLQTLNPTLIFAELSGFGPDSDLPAYDVVLQAEAGFLYMNGEPDREPVKMPVALIDILAAHQMKEAILIALLQRERTGKGSFIRASLLDAAIASLANQATNWLMAAQIPRRMGAQHPNIAPYGDICYTGDNKPIVLAVGSDRQFVALCQCLHIPELSADQRFASNAGRVQHRTQLLEQLRPAFLPFERNDLLAKLHQAGVPAASIRNMQEVFDLPAAQAMILEDTLPDGRTGRRVKTVAFTIE